MVDLRKDNAGKISCIAIDLDERNIGDRTSAAKASELVLLLGNLKADAILRKLGEIEAGDVRDSAADVLITADQVITHDGAILEKPLNREEAVAFLKGYSSGQCSTVGSIVITNLLTGRRVQVRSSLWQFVEIIFKSVPYFFGNCSL